MLVRQSYAAHQLLVSRTFCDTSAGCPTKHKNPVLQFGIRPKLVTGARGWYLLGSLRGQASMGDRSPEARIFIR